MDFEIIDDITAIETIASGSGIRDVKRLRKNYGKGRWRKLKGVARIRLLNGRVRIALNFIGMRRTGLGKGRSSGSVTWTTTMKRRKPLSAQFAVCIDNKRYPSSLELHKIYRVLPDEDAAEDGDIRVIDESGEDYLYSADRFVEVDLPQTIRRAILHAT